MQVEEEIKLTAYSHGSGCGCKIAPAELEKILGFVSEGQKSKQLIVGNSTKDDAAVYDLGDETALISTTDFFMPIVDDASDFGKIAAANAINDVYAMGGTPMMAIAILGWPIEKLGAELAGKVLEGGREMCQQAGAPLAGGHSIDSPEPIFGLAVNGRVKKSHLKLNCTAKPNSLLYLTKPLGTGIISTAQKRGVAESAHLEVVTNQMMEMNTCGETFGSLPYVNAMTDVTGFGLLGHLIEMCEGSDVSAKINFDKVPVLPFLDPYLAKFIYADNTFRNFNNVSAKCSKLDASALQILCDPQTSGGLLVSIDASEKENFERVLSELNIKAEALGEIVEKGELVVEVN